MPDEFSEHQVEAPAEEIIAHIASRVEFDIPQDDPSPQPDTDHLQILVAEDDPVNSKIITKRLEKSGHEVHHTINGEECATAYGEKPAFFDVVLMDMQMPIVDGLASAKMIRAYEKFHPQLALSPRTVCHGRVPIFAVSASLVERERQTYSNAGFDGWILKPIDFKRLSILLAGIVEDETRNSCLYKPGEWERGGWFGKRQSSVCDAETNRSDKPELQRPPRLGSERLQSDMDSYHSSESESMTPTIRDPPKALFVNESQGSAKGAEGTGPTETVDSKVEDITDQAEE